MLGRTAWGVTWMFRYLARAEHTARLIEAGLRMALTRGDGAARDEWRSVLVTLGQLAGYEARHGEVAGPWVTDFILRGQDNPASVKAMIEHARTNARMVRTALTREVWEGVNESWMTLGEALSRQVRPSTLPDTLLLIRRQAMLVRGAMETTMLRNEIFNFARIGAHLEAADSTARILDVKYHVLLPSPAWVGSQLDNAQWEMVLRSVAGERVFRWLNAGRLDARGIAQFLILDRRFPNSLAYSYAKLASNMNGLAREHGAETPSHAMAIAAADRLRNLSIGAILDSGLHEFLTDFIAENVRIAQAIATDYRFTQ
jgi:uncharacterized alpha-E superfamily protein